MDTIPTNQWRNESWAKLTERDLKGSREWDLLVIGGGITGAGILREATRRGLSACLIEQRDFAWGTSSRSSNMVHGGLRYLMAGRFKLTRDALRERARLLTQFPGLVSPLGFLFSDYRGHWPGRWSFALLLSMYDLFGRHWNHRYYPPHEFIMLAPRIKFRGLKGGAQSSDAVTDDARLVFRVIQEARMEGALALNYVVAEKLITMKGRVCGAVVRDLLSGETSEVHAKAVINATGAWTDRLRRQVGGRKYIRPLRGSHLVFPFWRLPIAQAIGLKHPADRRSVFLMPWEGVTVVGTTDLDHTENLDTEACITPQEVDYLLEIVRDQLPSLDIHRSDILTTWSGVRPVIGTGALNPSKEKRDHRIWIEAGLISVSGGKLTTFRLIALDVLRHATPFIPTLRVEDKGDPTLCNIDSQAISSHVLDPALRQRLIGRYGPMANEVFKCAKHGELIRVSGTDTFWVELRWAARAEFVVHLEDVLLRRTRLGVLLGDGGVSAFDRIRMICQEELGWDEAHWKHEADAYKNLWRRCHSVP